MPHAGYIQIMCKWMLSLSRYFKTQETELDSLHHLFSNLYWCSEGWMNTCSFLHHILCYSFIPASTVGHEPRKKLEVKNSLKDDNSASHGRKFFPALSARFVRKVCDSGTQPSGLLMSTLWLLRYWKLLYKILYEMVLHTHLIALNFWPRSENYTNVVNDEECKCDDCDGECLFVCLWVWKGENMMRFWTKNKKVPQVLFAVYSSWKCETWKKRKNLVKKKNKSVVFSELYIWTINYRKTENINVMAVCLINMFTDYLFNTQHLEKWSTLNT